MKHEIIYALCDPFTREVKYVGRTRKGIVERLEHHLGAARRNAQRPVYVWIRSLHPAVPIIVVLQSVENERVPRGQGKYESTAAAAETKWMKRFERSRIFNEIDKRSGAYKRLINLE